MEEEKRKAYSEVVEILKLIEDEQKLEKIPFEVIKLIKSNSDPMYKPQIFKEIPLENQNLRDETYAILGWISSKYWEENVIVENKEEQEEIRKIIEEHNLQVTENLEIGNAVVYNDIEPEAMELSENLPMLLEDLNWFQKFKAKVIKLFKLIFNFNKGEIQEGVK